MSRIVGIVWRLVFFKVHACKCGSLCDSYVCLFVCSYVCRLWSFSSHSLCGSTWRQAGAYRIDPDRLVLSYGVYVSRRERWRRACWSDCCWRACWSGCCCCNEAVVWWRLPCCNLYSRSVSLLLMIQTSAVLLVTVFVCHDQMCVVTVSRDERPGACSTAHRSNGPDHWDLGRPVLDRSTVGQL